MLPFLAKSGVVNDMKDYEAIDLLLNLEHQQACIVELKDGRYTVEGIANELQITVQDAERLWYQYAYVTKGKGNGRLSDLNRDFYGKRKCMGILKCPTANCPYKCKMYDDAPTSLDEFERYRTEKLAGNGNIGQKSGRFYCAGFCKEKNMNVLLQYVPCNFEMKLVRKSNEDVVRLTTRGRHTHERIPPTKQSKKEEKLLELSASLATKHKIHQKLLDECGPENSNMNIDRMRQRLKRGSGVTSTNTVASDSIRSVISFFEKAGFKSLAASNLNSNHFVEISLIPLHVDFGTHFCQQEIQKQKAFVFDTTFGTCNIKNDDGKLKAMKLSMVHVNNALVNTITVFASFHELKDSETYLAIFSTFARIRGVPSFENPYVFSIDFDIGILNAFVRMVHGINDITSELTREQYEYASAFLSFCFFHFKKALVDVCKKIKSKNELEASNFYNEVSGIW